MVQLFHRHSTSPIIPTHIPSFLTSFHTVQAILYAIAIYMPYWTNAVDALKFANTTLLGLFTIYSRECLYADRALVSSHPLRSYFTPRVTNL